MVMVFIKFNRVVFATLPVRSQEVASGAGCRRPVIARARRKWKCSFGSAHPAGAEGRRFKSCHPDQPTAKSTTKGVTTREEWVEQS